MSNTEILDPVRPDYRFAAEMWMFDHPDAMLLFQALGNRLVALGRKFGIGFLAERIRWEYGVERGDAEFKINNNYRAYIARELVYRNPAWENFIEFRTVAS